MATAKKSNTKAKVKVSNKPGNTQNSNTGNAPQQLPTVLSMVAIPTKLQIPTGQVTLNVNGKNQSFAANTAHNFCLNSITALGNSLNVVKHFFIALYNNYTLPGTMQYAVKPQYGIAYGITAKQASYKAICAHHKANGTNAIIINQCNSFTFASAMALAQKHNVTLLQGKGGKANWGIMQVTQASLGNCVSFVAALLNLVPVSGKAPIALPAPQKA
jgi:hypothetical protein